MNVILLIFDSLRKDCIECFGSPPWGKVYTPNLARFAEDSFIISRCYPESLPTLPARRAIYTGQRVYPFEDNKYYKGDFLGAPGWGPILENRTTISEILQAEGYTTALISDIQHMFKPSKNFHRGFNEWIWVRGYEVDHYRTGPYPSDEEINEWLPPEIRKPHFKKFLTQCLMNLSDAKKEEDYFVAKVIKESIRWLNQNKDKEKKFLVIESWSPHEPWFVPKKYKKIYMQKNFSEQVLSLYESTDTLTEEVINNTQTNYSALVTMCDHWFGYLYKEIKNLGMLDDTLIIVTTDHGHSIGDYNYIGKRGYPSTPEVFEIPILLRHPDNKLGRGIESKMLVQHTDIPATILKIIGVIPREQDYHNWISPINEDHNAEKDIVGKRIKMHGKSFFNELISGKNKFREHVTAAWGSTVTVVTEKWWLNCKVNGKGAFLYDLKDKEPFLKNVADKNPGVINRLFKLAVEDAGGGFPDYLIDLAENDKDAPGCSSLVALSG